MDRAEVIKIIENEQAKARKELNAAFNDEEILRCNALALWHEAQILMCERIKQLVINGGAGHIQPFKEG